ncbi:unnamed protein product [Menidia menidia]|uniref:(Atlantic silverside) hypothetical protein n=1 Tax=Menidia menidia TaxID=238744 RepID=A0A8S4AG06_9TELE|nr:unnamed protein product [Menidia menidia]
MALGPIERDCAPSGWIRPSPQIRLEPDHPADVDEGQLTKVNYSPGWRPSWFNMEEELVAPFSLEAFFTQMGRMVPSRDPGMAFVQETWFRAHQFDVVAAAVVSVSSSMCLLLIARMALCLMPEAKQVYPIGGDEQAQASPDFVAVNQSNFGNTTCLPITKDHLTARYQSAYQASVNNIALVAHDLNKMTSEPNLFDHAEDVTNSASMILNLCTATATIWPRMDPAQIDDRISRMEVMLNMLVAASTATRAEDQQGLAQVRQELEIIHARTQKRNLGDVVGMTLVHTLPN